MRQCKKLLLLEFYLTWLFWPVVGRRRWNTSSENFLEFHFKYCGRYCGEDGKLQMAHGNFGLKPPCYLCDCESDCIIYDTCCPRMINFTLSEPKTNLYPGLPDASRFVCAKLLNELNAKENEILFISDCDSKFLNNSMEDPNTLSEYSSRCQNSSTKTMDDITPYSDMYYGIVFKNKFCALCYGYTINSNMTNDVINSSVKVASQWSIEVSCEHFQQLYHLTSELELLIKASTLDVCSISGKPPKTQLGTQPKSCLVDIGLTSSELCLDSNKIFENHCQIDTRKFVGINPYENNNNIFCYMCLKGVSLYKCDCSQYDNREQILNDLIVNDYKHTVYPPIAFLLDVSRRYQTHENKCFTKNGWLYLQGECRAANCSSGKILTQDGHCSTALSVIRGLGYKLALTLIPINVLANEMKLLHDAIYKKLCSYSSKNYVDLKTSFIVTTKVNGTQTVHACTIRAYIVADANSSRDEIERAFLDMAVNLWTIRFNGPPVILKPLLLGEETVGLINFSLNVNSTEEYFRETNYQPTMHKDQRIFEEEVLLPNIWLHKDQFIDFTYSLLCPHVAVNISEVIPYTDGVNLTFFYHGRKFDIMVGPNISVVQRKLYICLDTFKIIIQENMTASLPIIILYYFQVVSFILSIACLFLSLLTYFLFRVLRSLPGLNNMALCVSMATAQICLLMAVEYGVKGFLPYGFCVFLAIVLHYSWLASFAWMSVCCIHMYVVFTSCNARSHSVSSDRRKFTRFCCYAFGVPAVIVALSVVSNLGATLGASFGYTASVCFIDTSRSILTLVMSLLVPLGAVVIINGILFALTLREMVHTARIQKATTNVQRQGVMNYVKLSTLTGIFCIISATAVWLDSIILQFLTCPLMALQGVFIFFSFIFTRRVYKLYFDLLGLQRLGFTLTTQGVSSTTSGIQDTKKRRHYISTKTDTTSI